MRDRRPNVVTGPRPENPLLLRRGNVVLDLLHREVEVDGRRIHRLAGRRFDILLALFRHEKPMDQFDLLIEIWGVQHDLKVVQMTVARLRDDLKGIPAIQILTCGRRYELVITAALAPQINCAELAVSRRR